MKLKRFIVRYYQIIDGLRERLEKSISDSFSCPLVTITNGKIVLTWFINESVSISFFDLIKRLLFCRGFLNNNWKQCAEYLAVRAISIEQAQDVLGLDIYYIPKEFFVYMEEFRAQYEEDMIVKYVEQ